MKQRSTLVFSLIIICSVITISCKREQKIESETINQIIPSIIDSISLKYAKLNDPIHFYVLDTLLKPLDSCRINYSILKQHGIIINDIELIEKEKCKLELKKDILFDTSKFSIITSFSDFNIKSERDSIPNVLLAFSRIYFNHEKNEGFFILLEYMRPKAAREYIVYFIKKNNYWTIRRMLLSGVG